MLHVCRHWLWPLLKISLLSVHCITWAVSRLISVRTQKSYKLTLTSMMSQVNWTISYAKTVISKVYNHFMNYEVQLTLCNPISHWKELPKRPVLSIHLKHHMKSTAISYNGSANMIKCEKYTIFMQSACHFLLSWGLIAPRLKIRWNDTLSC